MSLSSAKLIAVWAGKARHKGLDWNVPNGQWFWFSNGVRRCFVILQIGLALASLIILIIVGDNQDCESVWSWKQIWLQATKQSISEHQFGWNLLLQETVVRCNVLGLFVGEAAVACFCRWLSSCRDPGWDYDYFEIIIWAGQASHSSQQLCWGSGAIGAFGIWAAATALKHHCHPAADVRGSRPGRAF